MCALSLSRTPSPRAKLKKWPRYGEVTRSMVQLYLCAHLPWFANVAICRRAKGKQEERPTVKQRRLCITILPFPFGYSSSYQDPDPRKRRNKIIILPHVRATKYLHGEGQYSIHYTLRGKQKTGTHKSISTKQGRYPLYSVSEVDKDTWICVGLRNKAKTSYVYFRPIRPAFRIQTKGPSLMGLELYLWFVLFDWYCCSRIIFCKGRIYLKGWRGVIQVSHLCELPNQPTNHDTELRRKKKKKQQQQQQ